MAPGEVEGARPTAQREGFGLERAPSEADGGSSPSQAWWSLHFCTWEAFHLGLLRTQRVTGDWQSEAAHAHVHTPVCTCGFFLSTEETAPGMVWPQPVLATCLCFRLHRAWCVRPSGPRPACWFNPWAGHGSFSTFTKNLSILVQEQSRQNPPLHSFRSQMGTCFSQGLEDREEGAFRRCPVSAMALALLAACCCRLVWLGSR